MIIDAYIFIRKKLDTDLKIILLAIKIIITILSKLMLNRNLNGYF